MSLVDDLRRVTGLAPRFPHAERDLSKQYGLPGETLKKMRSQLTRGTDWDFVKGIIAYSAAGQAALEQLLKLPPAPGAQPPADSPPNNPPPPADTLADEITQVDGPTFWDGTRIPVTEPKPVGPIDLKKFTPPVPGEERRLVCVATVRNRHQVKAADGDRPAWVRVKDSKNFRTGMPMPARFLGGDKWELIGRCPRWTGKY